ncbi:MAG: DUF835 domain-containing protein, partial [Thermoplasmata archaeon]|nr:DUF835 domain-containing protein [Thermoplasmata archaeon]
PGVQVKIEAEVMSEEKEEYDLLKGSAYIVTRKEMAFQVFKEKVTHGMEGLCITREFPPKIRERYELTNTPIYWLSDSSSETEQTMHPARLAFEVKRTLNEFMKKSTSGIILFQGIEYLISHLSFLEILKWLQGLRDQGAVNETVMLFSIDPGALEQKEFRNLSIEFSVLSDE